MSIRDDPNERDERPRYRDYNAQMGSKQQSKANKNRSKRNHDYRHDKKRKNGDFSPSMRDVRNHRSSPYDMARHTELNTLGLPPYLQWLGVWEVQGQSRWNGSRMEVSIVQHSPLEYDIILKDLKRNQEFTLVLNPQIHTVAYWHLNDKKSTKRKYSGKLIEPQYNQVQWLDMHRRRRVDDWHRVDYLHPASYPTGGVPPRSCSTHNANIADKDNHRKTDRSYRPHWNRTRDKDRVYQPKDPALREDTAPRGISEASSIDHVAIESQLAGRHHSNSNSPKSRRGKNRNFGRNKNRASYEKQKYHLIPSPQHRPSQNGSSGMVHHDDPLLSDPAVLDFGSPQFGRKRLKFLPENPYQNYQRYGSRSRLGRREKRSGRRDDRHRRHEMERDRRHLRHKQRSRKPRYPSHLKGNLLRQALNSQTVFEGRIRIFPQNPYLAYVDVPELERVIRVEGLIARNRAFDGDTVAVKLLSFKEWKHAVNRDLVDFQRRLDARSEQMREDRNLHELDEEFEECASESDDGTIFDGVDVESVLEDVEDSDNEDESEDGMGEFRLDGGNSSESRVSRPAISTHPDESVSRINKLIVEYVAEDSEVVADIVAHHISPVLGPSGPNSTTSPSTRTIEPVAIENEEHHSLQPTNGCPEKQEGEEFAKRLGPPPTNVVLSLISQFTNNAQKHVRSNLTKDIWDSIPHPNDYLGYMPVGKVVSVTKEGNRSRLRSVCGYLEPIIPKKHGRISDSWAMFVPLDKRMPKALFNLRECPRQLLLLFDQPERLRTFFLETSYDLPWDEWNTYCTARFVEIVGKRGDIETETRIILSAHNIQHGCTFSERVHEECEGMRVDESDFGERRDCRSWHSFTIDPLTAQDFDDAISVEKCGDDLFRVGVHIADVSHFVKPGSKLDREAADRGTSVYLVDRCIPMLPHSLCHDLCSLNPGVDRYTFSVVFEISGAGEIVDESVWFGRTVIRSKARLDYLTAHEMITGTPTRDQLRHCVCITDETSLERVASDVSLFWSIAKNLRQKRFEDGAVRFSRPSIRFRLDENFRAVVVGTETAMLSQSLIEEFMLLANKLIARHLVEHCREHALLRRHPVPNEEGLERIKLIARSQRLKMDVSSSKKLNECLDEWDEKMYGDKVSARSILVNMITKKMSRAEYFCVGDTDSDFWRHYGLNFDVYTHFTSPIRRYADVTVHRLLEAVLREQKPALSSAGVDSLCKQINERSVCASRAEFDSQQVHLCLYVFHNPIVVEGYIVDMRKYLFVVVVPALGIQMDVRLSRIGAADATILLQPPDSQLVIQWHADESKETYELFSVIQLRLSSELSTPIRLIPLVVAPEHRHDVVPSLLEQQRPDLTNYLDDFLDRQID